ncbi:hypothetical protein ABH37_06145 [Mycobacterium haemophilum]|uniref:Multidrug ABC transporter ATPase n=1 Tax=Mycobacterium haemophilum TaxID=29311 RepID=A0A0I9U9M0_9MYCO|nr:hypothetical protein ABH39_14160 [Mycobacterium haemophilum]KLO37515.1 hypothetical protein ABH38_08620 [Mycobacterium haemophilum]KLO44062.1 hypothetical protein ABH37_06145 [Mycobacterium haemophilum]KLO49330.1 hypothetical protein ABH36_13010 [Mycobacterium haemophilum]
MALFLRELYSHRGRAIGWSLLLFALSAATGLALPPLLGVLVSAAESGTIQNRITIVVSLCALLLLIQTALTNRAVRAARTLGEQVLAELRDEFVKRVLALPMTTVEQAGTGDLLSRTTRDIDALSRNIRFTVPEVVNALLSMLFTLAALTIVSPLLVLPCLTSLPMLGAVSHWYFRRAPHAYIEESMAYSELNDGVSETIDGARTIEALGRGPARVSRTNSDIRKAYERGLRTLNLRSVWLPGVGVSSFIPIPMVLFVGGWLYAHHAVTIGQLTAAALYMHQFTDPVNRFAFYSNDFHAGWAALARLLGLPRAPDNCPQQIPTKLVAAARVVVYAINYSYRPGHRALRGVDLDVAPGEYVALVGPSGAGKSTLAGVLAGIYLPDSGYVTIGGKALGDMSRAELRHYVALVSQEQHLFTATLRDNVAMARQGATDSEIWSALEAVGASVWVHDLPAGIDTPIGFGGQHLSYSQGQQLALARILLVNPRVVVLDEATAGLQPPLALQLERSIVNDERIVISITHRLDLAEKADRIAVIDNGELSQLGTHEELVAENGVYAELWSAWIARPRG